jgi:hypothetical protein
VQEFEVITQNKIMHLIKQKKEDERGGSKKRKENKKGGI